MSEQRVGKFDGIDLTKPSTNYLDITDTCLPLTIGEFRKGVTAILDALKNVSGAKYHHVVEIDGERLSLGADTYKELLMMRMHHANDAEADELAREYRYIIQQESDDVDSPTIREASE